MSLLLIGLDEERGPAVVGRLLQEGDIVGVIEEHHERAPIWRELGAHVALGSPSDPDLVERAAQHARSIVIFASDPTNAPVVLDGVLEGARLTPGEAARVIYLSDDDDPAARATLDASAFDYVMLRVGRRGRFVRRGSVVTVEDLAEAVSAADDLAGEPRLSIDLTSDEGWRALHLDPR
ncbi:MAG: NAD-binding protein [Actinomycetota bacterium]|nr:NAD-binding protein [Actinomycetota bacterium]